MTKDNQVNIQRENIKICALSQVKIILQNLNFVDKMEVLSKILSGLAEENRMEGK